VYSRWRKALKFVLIGCGKAGHSHATIIDSHPRAELSAVIDTNPEAARAFGVSFGCKSYESVDQFLSANKHADCAILCAYPSENPEIACKLMQRRIHVLCEQPFALDSATAEKMLDVSRAYGVHLMMGSRFRHVADVIHARGLIQAGILGQVLEFEGDFRDVVDMRNRWNIQHSVSGGGVLMDRGCDAVDLVRHLFGPIQDIQAEESRRIQSPDVEDTVRLQVLTESGVIGSIHLSWVLKGAGDNYVRVYGTQGNLCLGWKKSIYRPNGAVDWIAFGDGYSTTKALTLQLSNFINSIADVEAPEMNAEDELECVRAIEEAYKSLRTNASQKSRPASQVQVVHSLRDVSSRP
jgi:predicted dehydrogenase